MKHFVLKRPKKLVNTSQNIWTVIVLSATLIWKEKSFAMKWPSLAATYDQQLSQNVLPIIKKIPLGEDDALWNFLF